MSLERDMRLKPADLIAVYDAEWRSFRHQFKAWQIFFGERGERPFPHVECSAQEPPISVRRRRFVASEVADREAA